MKPRILLVLAAISIFAYGIIRAQIAPNVLDAPLVQNEPLYASYVSGTNRGGSVTFLSGTNIAGNLPAANPGTFYVSISAAPLASGSYPITGGTLANTTGVLLGAATTGTAANLYFKMAGTGTTGWWPATSGTAAVQ